MGEQHGAYKAGYQEFRLWLIITHYTLFINLYSIIVVGGCDDSRRFSRGLCAVSANQTRLGFQNHGLLEVP